MDIPAGSASHGLAAFSSTRLAGSIKRIILQALALFAASDCFASETEIYKVRHRGEIVKLVKDGEIVRGVFAPLLGAQTREISFTGTRKDKEMDITIAEENPAAVKGAWVPTRKHIKLQKADKKNEIVWSETPGNGEDQLEIYRPMSGSFSEAALTLSPTGACSDYYGGLQLTVDKFPASPPNALKDLYLTKKEMKILEENYGIKEGTLKDGASISEAWDLLKADIKKDIHEFYLPVPIGSEAYFARKLREEGIGAALPGDCGGADIQLFNIRRSDVVSNGAVDSGKFKELLEKAVSNFFSTKNLAFRLDDAKLSTSPIPPHFPILQITIVADAKATRNKPDFWDKFNAYFYLADLVSNDSSAFSVVAHVERLFSISKGGRTTPPDDRWFEALLDETQEGTATYSLVAGMARSLKERCIFSSEQFEPPVGHNTCNTE